MKRSIPSFSNLTWKLIINPLLILDNFIYDIIWARCTGKISFVALSSTITLFSTTRSSLSESSKTSPLYWMDTGFWDSHLRPRNFNSWIRHSSYGFSRSPGPNILWTSMAAPIISFVMSLISSCLPSYYLFNYLKLFFTTEIKRFYPMVIIFFELMPMALEIKRAAHDVCRMASLCPLSLATTSINNRLFISFSLWFK